MKTHFYTQHSGRDGMAPLFSVGEQGPSLLCALLQDIVKLEGILTALCLEAYLNPLLL